MTPTLFLDRDGVLNVDHSYVFKIEDLELMPGVAGALSLAVDAGMRLVVVTNQGGVALDYYTEEQMQAFHGALADRLRNDTGGAVDIAAFYFCPHHPRSNHAELAQDCRCRKPAPGMIEQALEDFPDTDLSRSWLIGDKRSDINCARNAGLAGSVQILGNYEAHPSPDFSCQTVTQAVGFILKRL